MTRRGAALALFAAACAAGHDGPRDVAGAAVELCAVAPGTVRVLVFTSHECPIANAYAPTLRGLAERFRGDPVEWFVVHVDPDLAPAAAQQHAADFELPGRVVLEPDQATARALGVERTPEAAVLTTAGPQYVGRIDDQWRALGARQATAGSHDLGDAIAAVLGGGKPAIARRAAVGCLLPEPGSR